MSQPYFSVTIPAYKPQFLEEAINSILAQTYDYFELIIVDDCSPYDIKSVVKQYKDNRIRYYRNEKNCGAINVVDNWNMCLSYAKGDYVICMGDDDRLLPVCLEEYAKLIKKYPGIGLVHGWTQIIDEESKVFHLTTHRCEYETAMSHVWHRWNAYTFQYIGDFCFHTEWLRKQGGFYKIPLAWGSDNISAVIGATKNGVANTQVPVFQYRRNRYTISSTGNIDIKMKAILMEQMWHQKFIDEYEGDELDAYYKVQAKAELPRRFQKEFALTIAADIRRHPLRLLYWLLFASKYKVKRSSLIFALVQVAKHYA